MIQQIIRQSLRSMLRERQFQVAALVLSVFFVVSLLGTRNTHQQLSRELADATQTARQQWNKQEAKNPHSAAHYGTFAFKPAYPLSYFDRGIDAYTGNTLFLEAHKMNEPQHRMAADRSEFARLGSLTPAFVLAMLFPLLIIVLGFGTIAGERESGNLRLLLAQGVRPVPLFLGKTLGLWAATALLAVPFFVLGGWGLLQSGTPAESWTRYGFMVLAYLLYFGCFIHLTVLISARAKRTGVALMATLGAWIFVCLLLPKAAVNTARWLHPTPSYQAYQDAIKRDLENGVDGHDPADAYTEQLEKATLKQYGVDSVQHLPFNWDGFVMQKGEEHETFVFQKHKNDLLTIFDRQQQVHQVAALASPYLLVNLASQQLAQTDVRNYHDFLAAAERYRIQLVGELNNDLTHNFKYGDWGGKRDTAFFAKNIRFEYATPDLTATMSGVMPVLWLLMGWFLLSGLLGILIFKQLKPV
jgi:ABC-2 type transport system permease protein